MAIDESTTIKTPTAQRTKNIIGFVNAKYRRIMTGSPVTKNPLDLYTQCEFLDPWLLDFASSYYAFRNRYAEMKTMHIRGRSIQVVNGFKILGELSDKLKTFSYRVLKEDCLDLPDKILLKVKYN